MTEDLREIRRKKRVLEYAEKIDNINTTCRRFGIARSTFYLWRDRYRELGEAGLARRRRCSHNHPNKTPDEVVEKIWKVIKETGQGEGEILEILNGYNITEKSTSDPIVFLSGQDQKRELIRESTILKHFDSDGIILETTLEKSDSTPESIFDIEKERHKKIQSLFNGLWGSYWISYCHKTSGTR